MPDVETEANREEPSESSFKERMRQRLSTERESGEPAGPPDGYEEVNPGDESDVVDEVVEADPARQAEGEDEPELIEPTGDVDDQTEAVSDNSEDLIQRAEKAEERAKSMERDYRVKTHKIAAATRDLEGHSKVVKQQAEFILSIAEQGVTQFDSVNWATLQTKPEEYQRMRQMFEGAVMQRDHLKKQLTGIAEQHKTMLEQAKGTEAEVSKDILRTTIDGWSNELYGSLREYAVEELSYTAAEFDDMTDWRRLRDIHSQYQISQAPKQVTRLRRKKGKQPVSRQLERQTARPRNSKGQFESARNDFRDNPGPGQARSNFFIEKLRAERGR